MQLQVKFSCTANHLLSLWSPGESHASNSRLAPTMPLRLEAFFGEHCCSAAVLQEVLLREVGMEDCFLSLAINRLLLSLYVFDGSSFCLPTCEHQERGAPVKCSGCFSVTLLTWVHGESGTHSITWPGSCPAGFLRAKGEAIACCLTLVLEWPICIVVCAPPPRSIPRACSHAACRRFRSPAIRVACKH